AGDASEVSLEGGDLLAGASVEHAHAAVVRAKSDEHAVVGEPADHAWRLDAPAFLAGRGFQECDRIAGPVDHGDAAAVGVKDQIVAVGDLGIGFPDLMTGVGVIKTSVGLDLHALFTARAPSIVPF